MVGARAPWWALVWVLGPCPAGFLLGSDVFLIWKSWFFIMVALIRKKRKSNLSSPSFPSLGILFKSSISFQNIRDGTKNFHKDFLIGEGEIFEVYRAEIQNRTYAIKLFKQVWKELLSQDINSIYLLIFHARMCHFSSTLKGGIFENKVS